MPKWKKAIAVIRTLKALATIFGPMQMQILYQLSMQQNCPLKNIVYVNLIKNIMFPLERRSLSQLSPCIYLKISVNSDIFRWFPTTSDLNFHTSTFCEHLKRAFMNIYKFDLATLRKIRHEKNINSCFFYTVPFILL